METSLLLGGWAIIATDCLMSYSTFHRENLLDEQECLIQDILGFIPWNRVHVKNLAP